MQAYWLQDGTLTVDGTPLLVGVSATVSALADEAGVGIFLHGKAEEAGDRHRFGLGQPAGWRRLVVCHRDSPWWMVPKVATQAREVPPETQFLLADLADGRVLMALPLIDGWFRAALEGGEQGLTLVAETNDPDTVGRELTGLFVAVGSDPYALIAAGAAAVMGRLRTGRLRRDKPLPAFTDEFGWCTWDAFYGEVSADKVLAGLASFASGGVHPRFMILDDGWQTVAKVDDGQARLSALHANDKFPGGLRPLVTACRERFGLRHFLVWHAINGYWGGVDGRVLGGYQVHEAKRAFGPGVLHHSPQENGAPPRANGLVPAAHADRFFNDYHRHLMRQGVDGVKVDNQAVLEGLAEDQGGRVELTRAYREALEGSAHTHFLGNLINCMSCGNDTFLQALSSNLLRSSTDFWPRRPESHGLHLYTNALVSLWMGEFVHPDWDMFQSDHPRGALHAAARAIGGCPIYVSDKPGCHDFALLRKLVLSDGRVARCPAPGRPTRDCLFHDPVNEPVALKIFNHNRVGGVIGAFNCNYHEAAEARVTVSTAIRPGEVVGLAGERFAIYLHRAGKLLTVARDQGVPVTLAEAEYEIATIIPLADGFAPIGLTGVFNSGGTILALHPLTNGRVSVLLADGGEFLAWSQREPRGVAVDGQAIGVSYEAASHTLRCQVPGGGPRHLELSFA